MPTYISLVQFTDEGLQAAKETTQRVADRGRQGPTAWGKHQADVMDARSLRPGVRLRGPERRDGR